MSISTCIELQNTNNDSLDYITEMILFNDPHSGLITIGEVKLVENDTNDYYTDIQIERYNKNIQISRIPKNICSIIDKKTANELKEKININLQKNDILYEKLEFEKNELVSQLHNLREYYSIHNEKINLEESNDNDNYLHLTSEVKNLFEELSKNNNLPKSKEKLKKIFCCCFSKRKSDFFAKVRRIINLLNISPRKKSILIDRYIDLMDYYYNRKEWYTKVYNISHFLTTFCSLITPGLVSIQPFFGDETFTNPLYWASWGTSLIGGILQGYISLYKIDKKYFTLNKSYIQLETEGWQYFTLTGKYSNAKNGKATHANRFRKFCAAIETVRKGSNILNTENSGPEKSTPNIYYQSTTPPKQYSRSHVLYPPETKINL